MDLDRNGGTDLWAGFDEAEQEVNGGTDLWAEPDEAEREMDSVSRPAVLVDARLVLD